MAVTRLAAAATVIAILATGQPATVPAAAAGPEGSGSAPDATAVVPTLNREIPQLMKDAGVVGATVALVDRNQVLLAKGYGWAQRRPAQGRRGAALR